jgi:polar amino acid transport system substrate-binding protein
MGTSAEAAPTGDGEAADLGATFGALQPYESYNIAFTELQAGAIDAIAIDAPVAKQKIDTYGDEYYCLEESYASEKYGICFRLADTELCEQVEGAYMQLVEDGTYMALGEKYGLNIEDLKLAAE